LTEFALR